MYRGRFAPTPSGELHLGSLVSAVASYLDARSSGGEWLVRIEDVDCHRSRPAFDSAILKELERHGLFWDGAVVRQSERSEYYIATLEKLQAQKRLYVCRCSRAHLQQRGCPLSADGEFIYPGYCRSPDLPAFSVRGVVAEKAALRVCIQPDEVVDFQDRVRGHLSSRLLEDVGDFAVFRMDGCFAYHLAVVVDDFEQGVTHVVRGLDILPLTARQVWLQRILQFTTPIYHHVPLVCGADGQKLSKSASAQALKSSRALDNLYQALRHLGLFQLSPEHNNCDELLREACQQWSLKFKLPVSSRYR